MRIAVHAKVLAEKQLNGIGVYTYNILKTLAKIDHANQYVLYSNEPLFHKILAPNFTEKILHFPKFWSYLRLPFEFLGGGYDLLFVPKEFIPPFLRPKTVVVCYDLMGLIFADRISLTGRIHFWGAVKYAIPRADMVLAISGQTRKHVMESCGVPEGRVTVTHLGYDADVFKPVALPWRLAEVKKKYGIEGRYFLNTSSLLWYRKNLIRLIEAFKSFRDRHSSDGHAGAAAPGTQEEAARAALEPGKNVHPAQLVITGKKGEAYDEIVSLIGKLGLDGQVILTGYIDLPDVPVLLSGAEALVFPSLDEGFGLPLVEAMACGCPVITSNVSAMPEVAGEAGILVDPMKTEEIAGAMERLYMDRGEQERLRKLGLERAKGFSWEETARKTLEVFNKVASSK